MQAYELDVYFKCNTQKKHRIAVAGGGGGGER